MFHSVRILLPAVTLVAVSLPLCAQTVIDTREGIDFNRPEAWAMKRSASLTLLTSLAPPRPRSAGVFELALDLGWNPSLSEDERRVGFNGTKVESIDRLQAIPRVRATVGLGWDLSLDIAYTPPVEIEDLEPNLLTAALERPVFQGDRWVFGARIYGQMGTVVGDVTCAGEEAALPPGGPGNPFGCQEASNDEVTLDYAGVALTGGYLLSERWDANLHFALMATAMDLEFQVDALLFDLRDRTVLATDGWTYAALAGFSWKPSGVSRLAVEAFYTPLDVVRPPSTSTQNDGLFNLRAMFGYIIR
jgi:hypothetical protein